MGGRGSGGRRVGSGRKKLSDLERAVGGHAGKRGAAVVLQHPSASSTAVAPIETFDPPAEWVATPSQVTAIKADLVFLKQAVGPGDPNPQIADLEGRLEQLQAQADALAVWRELAPHAFTARTLTPATAATFLMLCRAVVKERALSASSYKSGGPDHRGMMARVATLSKDFVVAPFGKPLYAAEPAAPANPLDRFTKTRA
jgi:hypothetical protein